MGNLKMAAILLFLILFFTSPCLCDEVLERIKAIEEENKSQARKINLLEYQNGELLNRIVQCSTLVENKVGHLHEQFTEFEQFMNLVTVPQTCGQLSLFGVTKPKKIRVDPDGKGANNGPIEVFITL